MTLWIIYSFPLSKAFFLIEVHLEEIGNLFKLKKPYTDDCIVACVMFCNLIFQNHIDYWSFDPALYIPLSLVVSFILVFGLVFLHAKTQPA